MSPRTRRPSPAAVFAALGDETRLGLVQRLSDGGPASIASLTEGSGVTRQAVTKHLRVLAGAGLVHATRAGRETSWRLLPGGLRETRERLERIAGQWDAALTRLETFVEARTPVSR